ncbi:MAG TPA: hypothetical protein PKZ12_02030 [Smithellaceae bacterium]|nr:hypothetical protein [Smithellaceae bacterium]
MEKKNHLEQLIRQKSFRFDHLSIAGIDNAPVAKIFSPAILEQEICLFANDIKNGDEYCARLHERLLASLQKRSALPIVRFADGEYAFYNLTLGCNGLYKQAESVAAIEKVIPLHIRNMQSLAVAGLFAPLVCPTNSNTNARGFFPIGKAKKDSSANDFLNFLNSAGIALHSGNYLPFYVVYAYLTSAAFAAAVNGKRICILNSEYNEKSCREWFALQGSFPRLDYVPIPAEYAATRWQEYSTDILNKIAPDTDLCLAGAGVGALLICVDAANKFSLPAIDAGHVLNMMNGRADKSNGARLYTLRKNNG